MAPQGIGTGITTSFSLASWVCTGITVIGSWLSSPSRSSCAHRPRVHQHLRGHAGTVLHHVRAGVVQFVLKVEQAARSRLSGTGTHGRCSRRGARRADRSRRGRGVAPRANRSSPKPRCRRPRSPGPTSPISLHEPAVRRGPRQTRAGPSSPRLSLSEPPDQRRRSYLAPYRFAVSLIRSTPLAVIRTISGTPSERHAFPLTLDQSPCQTGQRT